MIVFTMRYDFQPPTSEIELAIVDATRERLKQRGHTLPDEDPFWKRWDKVKPEAQSDAGNE